MSKAKSKKSARAELLARMWDLGRRSSTQTVFLHEAIAQTAGLNATDTKCIDLILRAGERSVTAGWLSNMTGLTTGAITHILDRLEKRNYIQRVRDTEDRRRVLIHVVPKTLEPLHPKYEAIGRAFMSFVEQYNDDELATIVGYLEKTCEISEQQLQKLIAEGGENAERSARK